MILPLKPKQVEKDINKYLFLIYGREKIGKTTLLSQWPRTLFFSTEPGTKGLSIYEVEIREWKDIIEAVKLLEKDKRFSTIAIDTADRAYDMCLNYVCDKLNIPYPGEDDEGKADFGKSWRAVKTEFLSMINRIQLTGRGVVFTSHSQEIEITPRGGMKWNKIVPTMSKQARVVIEALVDFFFYAEYVRDIKGNIRRVLICEGDETIWAGHRKALGEIPFARILPLLEKGGYDIIVKAFQGQGGGLDPLTLIPSKLTTTSGKGLLAKAKASGAGAKLPVAKKKSPPQKKRR